MVATKAIVAVPPSLNGPQGAQKFRIQKTKNSKAGRHDAQKGMGIARIVPAHIRARRIRKAKDKQVAI